MLSASIGTRATRVSIPSKSMRISCGSIALGAPACVGAGAPAGGTCAPDGRAADVSTATSSFSIGKGFLVPFLRASAKIPVWRTVA